MDTPKYHALVLIHTTSIAITGLSVWHVVPISMSLGATQNMQNLTSRPKLLTIFHPALFLNKCRQNLGGPIAACIVHGATPACKQSVRNKKSQTMAGLLCGRFVSTENVVQAPCVEQAQPHGTNSYWGQGRDGHQDELNPAGVWVRRVHVRNFGANDCAAAGT